MAQIVNVPGAGELKPGSGVVVRVGDETIALFNADGVFYAVDNSCLLGAAPWGKGPSMVP